MSATADDTVALILAWHDALNAGDVQGVLSRSTSDVRIGGPRGTTTGHEALAGWIAHAGIELTPTAIYATDTHASATDSACYVEQDARWPNNPAANPDELLRACTLFEVRNHLVAATLRYGTLEDALAATGGGRDALERIWPPA